MRKREAISENERFREVSELKDAGKLLPLRGTIPGASMRKGDKADIEVIAFDPQHRKRIRLKEKIAEGGEGSVFITNIPGYVAKIYHADRITQDRRAKIETMVSKPVQCEGICFPSAFIENDAGDFVGYLMPQARGIELASSVFKPKLLLRKFPSWTRRDLITLCVTILEKIRFLNDRRIILGDINPMNILVETPSKVYFVDCDSYQIEGYPCPVGTPNFTPPEVIGRDFKTFLRTQEMENFAIATLLFMIMLPGKAPYSSVGGASPAENIRQGNFVYAFNEADGSKTPPGRWGFMWSHLSYNVREKFFQTFKKSEPHFNPEDRLCADEWLDLFERYHFGLTAMGKHDPMSLEIMPSRPKLRTCKKEGCDNKFVPDDSEWSYCAQHRRRASPAVTAFSPKPSPTNQKRWTEPRTKTCPYCKTRTIPANWDHCDSCKNVIVETRSCVNCLKPFSVTAGMRRWEATTGFKNSQCPTCKAAHCKGSPCVHAAKAAAGVQNTRSKTPQRVGTGGSGGSPTARGTKKELTGGSCFLVLMLCMFSPLSIAFLIFVFGLL